MYVAPRELVATMLAITPLLVLLSIGGAYLIAGRAFRPVEHMINEVEAITDASPAAVEDTFARYGIDRIIHGHTHRPAMHDGAGGTRIVLGDWYEQGSVLRVTPDSTELSNL